MTAADIGGRLTELAVERRRERSSAADVAATVLRDLILEGALPPGSRVSEEAFIGPLEVSRNTLREAFRLLTHERLLIHKLNRGVFVRRLDADDVKDLFQVRRLVECTALLSAGQAAVPALSAVVEVGERAAAAGHWVDVGTANLRFHQAIAGLAGSARIDQLMHQVSAELRLGFHEMGDPKAFHEGYLTRNRGIVDTLATGDTARAESQLRGYLDDAEREMLDVIGRR